MVKNFLIAAALLIASPAMVFSQDIFWSFAPDSATNTAVGVVGTSGTAYIFSDQPFGFDAIDLDFNSSDSAVLLLTGGAERNDPFAVIGSTAFNSSIVTVDAGGATGSWFAVNATQNGITPDVSPLFNPHFDAGVGPNGAVLLASVDYDIVGEGAATLGFSLGPQGALELPSSILSPTFGSATLTGIADVPEPSSAVLLVLGTAGLVSRRRRSHV